MVLLSKLYFNEGGLSVGQSLDVHEFQDWLNNVTSTEVVKIESFMEELFKRIQRDSMNMNGVTFLKHLNSCPFIWKSEFNILLKTGDYKALYIASIAPNLVDIEIMDYVEEHHGSIFYLLVRGKKNYKDSLNKLLQEQSENDLLGKIAKYFIVDNELLASFCENAVYLETILRLYDVIKEYSGINISPLFNAMASILNKETNFLTKIEYQKLYNIAMRNKSKKKEELFLSLYRLSPESKLILDLQENRDKVKNMKLEDFDLITLIKVIEDRDAEGIPIILNHLQESNSLFFQQLINEIGVYLLKNKSRLSILPFLYKAYFTPDTLHSCRNQLKELPKETLIDFAIQYNEMLDAVLDVLMRLGKSERDILLLLEQTQHYKWIIKNRKYVEKLMKGDISLYWQFIQLIPDPEKIKKDMEFAPFFFTDLPVSFIENWLTEHIERSEQDKILEFIRISNEKNKSHLIESVQKRGISQILLKVVENQIYQEHNMKTILGWAAKMEHPRITEIAYSRIRIWLFEFSNDLDHTANWTDSSINRFIDELAAIFEQMKEVSLLQRIWQDIPLWTQIQEKMNRVMVCALFQINKPEQSLRQVLYLYECLKKLNHDEIADSLLKNIAYILSTNQRLGSMIPNVVNFFMNDPQTLKELISITAYNAQSFFQSMEYNKRRIEDVKGESIRDVARHIREPLAKIEKTVIELMDTNKSGNEVVRIIIRLLSDLRFSLGHAGIYPVEDIDHWIKRIPVPYDQQKHESTINHLGPVRIESLGIRLQDEVDEPLIDPAKVSSYR